MNGCRKGTVETDPLSSDFDSHPKDGYQKGASTSSPILRSFDNRDAKVGHRILSPKYLQGLQIDRIITMLMMDLIDETIWPNKTLE